jgi:DNA-binding transcriptional regulator WhiA
MRKETAFILGAMEDGSLSSRPKIGDFTIEIEQKNEEWLKKLARYFETSFSANTHISERKSKGVFRLRIYSKEIFQEIKKLRKSISKIQKQNREVQRYFLRAVFDAEGSVHNKKFRITLSNKNEKLLLLCKKLLKNFEIETKKIWVYKWGVKVLPVLGKENLNKFKKKIGFSHSNKNLKLTQLLKSG